MRLKRACSQQNPCNACYDKNDVCTYDWVLQKSFERGMLRVDMASTDGAGALPDPDQDVPREGQHDTEPTDLDGFSLPGFYSECQENNAFRIEKENLASHSPRLPEDEAALLPSSNDGPRTLYDSDSSSEDLSDADFISIKTLPFLSRFTMEHGFLESFDCGSLEERKALAMQENDHELRVMGFSVNNQNSLSKPTTGGPCNSLNASSASLGDLDIMHGSRPDLWSFGDHAATEDLFLHVDLGQSQITQPRLFGPTGDNGLWWSIWSSDNLAFKTCEVVDELKSITANKGRGSKIAISWSYSLERISYEFFSPRNLRRFLAYFWSSWYPNCPIVHRPTFDAAQTSPLLLLSMVLIGACMSPRDRDHAGANIWFNSLEELVFSCDDLYDNIGADAGSNRLDCGLMRRGLDILQASYFVCLLQNWEGSAESKRRVRRHRYSSLVAVSLPCTLKSVQSTGAKIFEQFARDFGFSNATLRRIRVDDVSMFKWNIFIMQESLIRFAQNQHHTLRTIANCEFSTFTYIFLLDSAFAIFNNLPPRLVVRELKMDLASPECCFRAGSSEECFIRLRPHILARATRRALDLSCVVTLICQPEVTQENHCFFTSLSTLNMFTTITGECKACWLRSHARHISEMVSDRRTSALHSLAFSMKNSLVSDTDMSPICAGISNWKRFWVASSGREASEVCDNDLLSTMWTRIGFIRHALEFWLLVKFKVKQLGDPRSAEKSADDGLQNFQDVDFNTKYDADMSQVHALVTALYDLQLSSL